MQAEKLHIEMDNVEKGLMQFIAQYNIEKLAMGAASDDSYHMYECCSFINFFYGQLLLRTAIIGVQYILGLFC